MTNDEIIAARRVRLVNDIDGLWLGEKIAKGMTGIVVHQTDIAAGIIASILPDQRIDDLEEFGGVLQVYGDWDEGDCHASDFERIEDGG